MTSAVSKNQENANHSIPIDQNIDQSIAQTLKNPEFVINSRDSNKDSELDPFGLPQTETKAKKQRIQTAEPTHGTFSEKEPNKVLKELTQEIEKKCVDLHPNLSFYERIFIGRGDLAQYTQAEAKKILIEQSHLNQEQATAALQCVDDLNIQALAGTGKTSLLSASISYLLALGVDPETIAISSHTVTAAEEIKNRIGPTLGRLFPKTQECLGNQKPTAGTIHAIAYREMITHKHPKAQWTILDEAMQARIWREATMFAFPDSPLATSEEAMLEEMKLFDRIRGYDIPETKIQNLLKMISGSEEISLISQTYEKIKEARKLIDYTDLLREWAPIIIHPGYTGKWEYFFVDEFQDTNPLQKYLLKLLKLQGAKLIVCGDSRQSINSFTGSDPTSHLGFFKEMGIKDAWLETNYRCSKEILALANQVIGSMNPPEKGRLLAHNNAPEGEPAQLVITRKKGDRREFLPPKEAEEEKRREARISCQEAIRLYDEFKEDGEKTPSIAVLYRTNAQGSLLEEIMACINNERSQEGLEPIKYVRKDYRRTALRNKTERDTLEMLSAWTNPADADWENLLLNPYFHGVGEVTARAVRRKAEKLRPKTLKETETIFEGELSKRNAETIAEFFLAWEQAGGEGELGKGPNGERACTALQDWIAKSSSKKKLEPGSKKETEEAQRRSYEAGIFEKITQKTREGKYLVDSIEDTLVEIEKAAASQNLANRATGLGMMVTENNANANANANTNGNTTIVAEKEEGLILSTIHLAKGREYDGVVIHQVSRGSLPHFNALKFYENASNWREKSFRKYANFPSLQEIEINFEDPDKSLPRIWRTGIPESKAANPIEEWEDQNNPIEEEKRLLYVAITRAKQKLVLTSKDFDYKFLPEEIWEKLKKGRRFYRE